ncbi:MAG: TetR/AcrR family transcriptional regulator [Cyanobacteria bacterium P01_H01_bin.121]
MTRTLAASATATKEQIINAAERLFAERGFAATTLRNVVSEAGVNLAAVHYHFGSKEELFRAAVARFARPVVAEELALLAQLQASDEPLTVEAILTALIKPCLEFLMQDEETRIIRAQFMGRCRTEPGPIQSIAANEFNESQEAFLDVLQRVLPDQSRSQLHWKFDLVIAALIRIQTEAGQPFALLQSTKPEDVHKATEQLVKFLSPGMRS